MATDKPNKKRSMFSAKNRAAIVREKSFIMLSPSELIVVQRLRIVLGFSAAEPQSDRTPCFNYGFTEWATGNLRFPLDFTYNRCPLFFSGLTFFY